MSNLPLNFNGCCASHKRNIFLTIGKIYSEPGREADHPPPFSAEDKNAWRYTSNHPTGVGMAQYLVSHTENITFTFISTFTPTMLEVISFPF